ncbi:Transmembrane protein 165 [Strongyloides ratti]|uniref:GDT1 family protein n=1 Tax=Strongyloides ratti TaxID=34506 RepID=A0A090LD98_STRRB|nr:Transmembrane protein 165 [Strongyloides ratti]CEF67746.1 Transmembrane protein 165 [Strongyloides ratti]
MKNSQCTLGGNYDIEDTDTKSVDDESFKKIKEVDLHENAKNVEDKIIKKEDNGFISGFTGSFLIIIVSEIGDKTWFIAAIMSMRYPRLIVFSGAISALAVMTVLSVFVGWLMQVVPGIIVFWISTGLFAVFGVQMLYEGLKMSSNEGAEELEEAQAEVQKSEVDIQTSSMVKPSLEQGGATSSNDGKVNSIKNSFSYSTIIFMKSFSLTFLAEWGDRSQIATIALGAVKDVFGVILGGVIGHSICTGIAVIGGRVIAQKISVRTVTIIGGFTFIFFALANIVVKFFIE